MPAWIQEHESLVWVSLASAAMGVLAALAASVVIVHLPADYFEKPKPKARGGWGLVRNISGWLLIVAGIAMLPLPGPGAVVILLGVMMADFPGKTKVQRWILARGPILKPANWLRARFHRPPLKAPKKRGQGSERRVPAPS